jgi:hypothetical protein
MKTTGTAAGLIETVVSAVTSPVISGIASFNRWRLPALDAPHPLLTGIHKPMSEELTLCDLTVEGMIPSEMDGRYVRIGPNPVAPDPRSYHFFAGDGMLHGIRIAGGRAHWYRNRWIRSTEVDFAPRLARVTSSTPSTPASSSTAGQHMRSSRPVVRRSGSARNWTNRVTTT